jgi:hypothetical protein
MAKKPTQETFDVFKQKRIPALETQAEKFDTARSVRAEQKGVMGNAELKIREIMLANADKLDHQEDENHHKILVYELGDVKITCKTTEAVGVRIGKDTKGSIGDGAPDGPQEGGE